ncbi:hypothetical protein RIF25_14805 [Thermosynechococcaceae cyanobacterium BACA0444]|uniref:Uncharacterized protein n=1 Tax=Pseudocalidococcus azoricus BACA0444 TaxID=2918990 RepID=A0AAE4FTP5_9CYAN|nr:hypothetical protein [Pseudocalidococcus azoricus]MDS3862070.1 hypothetical protein [Pseudocalidococcus azoricus BACA0444]
MGTLIGLVLVMLYLAGGWKFWNGFERTSYAQSRFILTILWPVMITNKTYRQNFARALKG